MSAKATRKGDVVKFVSGFRHWRSGEWIEAAKYRAQGLSDSLHEAEAPLTNLTDWPAGLPAGQSAFWRTWRNWQSALALEAGGLEP